MHRLCVFFCQRKEMLITSSRQRHDEATSRGCSRLGFQSPETSPSSALCPSAWPHRAPLGPDPTARKRPGTCRPINLVGPSTCCGFFPTRGRPGRSGSFPIVAWRAGVGCSAVVCGSYLLQETRGQVGPAMSEATAAARPILLCLFF